MRNILSHMGNYELYVKQESESSDTRSFLHAQYIVCKKSDFTLVMLLLN